MVSLKQRLAEGYIHSRAIIEVAGKPKENVEKALRAIVDKVDETEAYEVVQKEFEEAEEKEGLWSAFVEVEILTKSAADLAWFCYDFMPSSVEIIEPANIAYPAQKYTSFLNELQKRVHDLDLALKTAARENKFLKQNANALLKNMVFIALDKKPQSLSDLAKFIGMQEEKLQEVIELYKKNDIVEEKSGKLFWKK